MCQIYKYCIVVINLQILLIFLFFEHKIFWGKFLIHLKGIADITW